MRLTLVGAVYITARLPAAGVPDPEVERAVLFRRHQLLIIVVVTMDFMAQVQAYVMSHQYESLLKKANFKGAGFPGTLRSMSKEDVIEMQGEVVENLPNATFRDQTRKRACGSWPHLRKDADALHSHPPRRQGHRAAHALRPFQGPYRVPRQVVWQYFPEQIQ
jgi:hypothetical protein